MKQLKILSDSSLAKGKALVRGIFTKVYFSNKETNR